MKAQVLHKYDPEMKEKVWVTEQEMPRPKVRKVLRCNRKNRCCRSMQN